MPRDQIEDPDNILTRVAEKCLIRTATHIHSAIHLIRDRFYHLNKEYRLGVLKREPDRLQAHTRETGKQITNILQEVLAYFDDKDSIITTEIILLAATIPDGPKTEEEWKEQEVYILCRNAGFPRARARTAKRHYTVDKSTALSHICVDGEREFAVPDLEEFERVIGSPYASPQPNRRDHYSTKIMVPIQMEKRHFTLEEEANEDSPRDVLGFIGCDASEPNSFIGMDGLVELMFCVADGLYHYFERANHYEKHPTPDFP